MLRTQIYLPEELRKEIDAARRWSGKSLSDYLREAAEEKTKKDKQKKQDLKLLAEQFVGSAKGTRSKKEINNWVQEIRKDRRLEDEHWEKRWDEAVKSIKK